MDEAGSLCERVGQWWRAAILEGWRLHHDPNYKATNPSLEKVKRFFSLKIFRFFQKKIRSNFTILFFKIFFRSNFTIFQISKSFILSPSK